MIMMMRPKLPWQDVRVNSAFNGNPDEYQNLMMMRMMKLIMRLMRFLMMKLMMKLIMRPMRFLIMMKFEEEMFQCIGSSNCVLSLVGVVRTNGT